MHIIPKQFAPLLLGILLAAGCGAQSNLSTTSESLTTSGNLITLGGGGAVSNSAIAWGSGPLVRCRDGACWDNLTGALVSVNGREVGSVQRKPKPKYTLAQVRASAVAIPKAKLAPAAYLTLAKSIGLESAGTDEASMLDCLDKLSLKPYDVGKVDAYLSHKAEAQGANVMWVWKPLRESDEKAAGPAFSAFSARAPFALSLKRYGQAVPAHALSVVAEVLRELPDAVFLVSDYEAVKPDPFLAVTTPRLLQEGRVWIVWQWDEPNFGPPEIHFGPAESRSVEAKQPEPVRLTTD